MEIRQLRYFVAVAEELHFGRAAKRLHMAQSPLSQQIRQLERALGVQLIDRPHSVVGLTDAGRTFLDAARTILAELEEAERRARRAARGEVGTLRVGYVNEVTADLLPLGLRALRERCPDIEVELTEGGTGALLDDLRQGRLDVAVVRSPVLGDLDYEQLISETLMLAAPAGSYVAEKALQLEDLAGEPLVLPTPQAARGLRIDIDAACQRSGFEPRAARETNSLTAVLLLVAGGAGLALVPASAAHLYPVPGVEYVHLAPPAPHTGTGMAWRARDPSRVLRQFLEVLRETAAERAGLNDVWPERRVVSPAAQAG